MKKIVGFTLLITLISYLLLLSKYLVIEEILGFYLIPILLVIIVASLLYGLIRIFKAISYKKTIINSLLVACILQIGIISLILWSATPRYFSRNQVIKDIDYAIKIAEDVHPNLYAVISKESFYAKTDSIKKTFPEKMSDAAAYRTLGRIFSQIQDGHTGGGWNFFDKRGSGAFRKTLPYKINIKDERLFISKNYFYRNTIPIGSEILEINGKPSNQCLQEISQLISYEIIPFRNSILKNPMFWGLWNDFKDFKITYKTPQDNQIKTIKASGGLISKLLFLKDSKNTGKAYKFKTIKSNIGFLEFNKFRDLDKFKLFLDTTFTKIKKENVNNLIIDIRKNGGGNSSLGDELMQYISKTDFNTFDSGMVKISEELTKNGMLNWLDSSQQKIGRLHSFFDTSKTKLRDNPLRFNGNTFLLIGGNTFSSATNFASVFQCYNVGEIIGDETGGLTVSFGDVYRFILPNTRFDMGVSYKKFYNACGVDNRRGVIPDYIVKNSFEDEQKRIDRVLDFTIDLIKEDE